MSFTGCDLVDIPLVLPGAMPCQRGIAGAYANGSQIGDQTTVTFNFPSICSLLGVASPLGDPSVSWTSTGIVDQNNTAFVQQVDVSFGDGSIVILQPMVSGTTVHVTVNGVTQTFNLSTVQDLVQGLPSCLPVTNTGRRLLEEHMLPHASRSLLLSTAECQTIQFFCQTLLTAIPIAVCLQEPYLLSVIEVACNPVLFPASVPTCVAALAVAVACTGAFSNPDDPSLSDICKGIDDLDGYASVFTFDLLLLMLITLCLQLFWRNLTIAIAITNVAITDVTIAGQPIY